MEICCEVRELIESQSKTNVCYWDGTNIVMEQTNGGSVKHYLRGINLIASEMDGMLYYYILNEHGDVAQIWKENGTRKAFYEYDAFDEKNLNPDDENPFRYCGEYWDKTTTALYLRNRDYRNQIGRFISEDMLRYTKNKLPNEQEIIQPLSLNLYTYCYNNPVLLVDSSGNSPSGKDFDLGKGWTGRIEQHGSGEGLKRHVHVYKGDKHWAQNQDGTPHDDGKNSPGSPPKKVLKSLEEKKEGFIKYQ